MVAKSDRFAHKAPDAIGETDRLAEFGVVDELRTVHDAMVGAGADTGRAAANGTRKPGRSQPTRPLVTVVPWP